jgi:hypothetical protein
VRCRTCHSDHDYRHEEVPPSKADLRKAALFQEVLRSVDPEAAMTEAAVPADPIVEEAPKAKAKSKGRK